jgi:hypothetical protein
MNYLLGVLGTWILADGVSSLYTYTCTEKKNGQTWLKDHSFRVLRCMIGVAVIAIGAWR